MLGSTPEVEETVSITNKFKEGLSKTRNQFTSKVNDLVAKYRKVDEDFLRNLRKFYFKQM